MLLMSGKTFDACCFFLILPFNLRNVVRLRRILKFTHGRPLAAFCRVISERLYGLWATLRQTGRDFRTSSNPPTLHAAVLLFKHKQKTWKRATSKTHRRLKKNEKIRERQTGGAIKTKIKAAALRPKRQQIRFHGTQNWPKSSGCHTHIMPNASQGQFWLISACL